MFIVVVMAKVILFRARAKAIPPVLVARSMPVAPVHSPFAPSAISPALRLRPAAFRAERERDLSQPQADRDFPNARPLQNSASAFRSRLEMRSHPGPDRPALARQPRVAELRLVRPAPVSYWQDRQV